MKTKTSTTQPRGSGLDCKQSIWSKDGGGAKIGDIGSMGNVTGTGGQVATSPGGMGAKHSFST